MAKPGSVDQLLDRVVRPTYERAMTYHKPKNVEELRFWMEAEVVSKEGKPIYGVSDNVRSIITSYGAGQFGPVQTRKIDFTQGEVVGDQRSKSKARKLARESERVRNYNAYLFDYRQLGAPAFREYYEVPKGAKLKFGKKTITIKAKGFKRPQNFWVWRASKERAKARKGAKA